MALATKTTAPSGWANDAAYSNYQTAQQIAQTPYQGYQGNMLAPWNAGQQTGYNAAVYGQGAGLGAMQAGQNAAQGAAAFQGAQITPWGEIAAAPQSWTATSAASAGPAAQMTAASMQAANAGPAALANAANAGPAALANAASAGPAAQMTAAQAALAQAKAAALARGEIRDVNAQDFTQADLGQYMNPYTSNVIDTTLNTLGRQRDVLQNQANAQAAKAGAFGGSRQAVMNSENNRAYLDTAASTTAGLNNANFAQALAAIQTDQNRDLQAQLANQNQDWNVGNLNTSNQQQTAIQNMLAANQTNQYNATNKQNASQWNAGATNQQNQYNAGLKQQTNLSNQAALNNMAQYNAGLTQQTSLSNQAATNNMAQYNAGLTQQANQTNSGYAQAANASNQAATNNMAQYNATNAQRANEASAAAENTAGINNQAAYNNMAQFNADTALRTQMANQTAAQNAANTRLSAANALNGMGLDQQTQLLNGANASFNMGQAMTQHGQAQADIDYQQWMKAQQYPQQQLAMLQSGLAGVPYGSTSTAPGASSNTAANILAGVGGAAAIAANGTKIVSGAQDLYGGIKSLLPW